MNDEDKRTKQLTSEELLYRHQLNIAHYWQLKGTAKTISNDDKDVDKDTKIPEKWNLLGDIKLHHWQKECKEKWMAAGKRGVVKVVTGAGKTILALAIAQEIQNKMNKDLCVTIVVPTIVLMGQWYDALLKFSNLPKKSIGRMGSGYSDDLSGDVRVLICVLASASNKLRKAVQSSSGENNLFLIVDECHKAGAEKMSQIFSISRAYTLGLSATPEREDVVELKDENAEAVSDNTETEEIFDDTVIGKELGSIFYDLNFNQAIDQGIMPKFEIRHYGLTLLPNEAASYEKLSREITDLRKELQRSSKAAGAMDGGALVGWARKLASRKKSKFTGSASAYVQNISKRKLLLYHAQARQKAVVELLRREFAQNPETRAILFHESIDEVMRLFYILKSEGFRSVPENSKLPDSLRNESISLFRKGHAQVLISARSLIEGFDVPAADVGIVVASSTSVRQRIQTLGRILRKHKGIDGEEKHSVLHVLYMANTVDEMIYEKNNWDNVIGSDQNIYYLWNPESNDNIVLQADPPRRPLPTESEIDWSSLNPGDVYPGKYEGVEYSADSKGNIYSSDNKVVSNPGKVYELLNKLRPNAGKFRITFNKKALLFLDKEKGAWITIFAGFLDEPFQFLKENISEEVNVTNLNPGDSYPNNDIIGEKFNIKRKSSGLVIVKKVRRGEVYARLTSNPPDPKVKAVDPIKGMDAEKVIGAIDHASSKEPHLISQFVINKLKHAVYISEGQVRFLCALERGFEFSE